VSFLDRAGAAWNLLVNPARPVRGTALDYIGPNDAGVPVTHERAFMVAAVWACIDIIASAVASSDWNVVSGLRYSGNVEAMPDDPLQRLLNIRPNPEMTALSAKRALLIAAVGWGNGYAEIGWDMAGRPTAIWPISPDRVLPQRDPKTGELVYRVAQDYVGGFVMVPAEDMLHIRGGSLTGLHGDDTVAKAVKSIAIAIALDQFSASYFANGTHVGGVITAKSKLDQPSYDRLQEQLNKKHQGSRQSFKNLLLDNGATFEQLDSNAQKSELIQSRILMIEEIARWFRVPPHKLGHLIRATNNNIEHQGIEFARDSLRPWKKEIEQECDFKLVNARGPKKYIDIDLDWATEGDYLTRMQALQVGRAMGVLSTNDILRKLGENTISAEEGGDLRIVNGASIPLERVGQNYPETGTPVDPATAGDDAATEAGETADPAGTDEGEDGGPSTPTNVIRREALEFRRKQGSQS
jgi:HK97 family phage portal protein